MLGDGPGSMFTLRGSLHSVVMSIYNYINNVIIYIYTLINNVIIYYINKIIYKYIII